MRSRYIILEKKTFWIKTTVRCIINSNVNLEHKNTIIKECEWIKINNDPLKDVINNVRSWYMILKIQKCTLDPHPPPPPKENNKKPIKQNK